MIQELAEQWRKSGVQEGDVLLLHSNTRRTLRQFMKSGSNLTPQLILESFQAAVGCSGTILLPLFNFDFTQGVPFDIRSGFKTCLN